MGLQTKTVEIGNELTPEPRQLTLEGQEVPLNKLRRRRLPALTRRARAALALLEEEGPLRGVDIGVSVHARHGCPDTGERWNFWTGRRSKSCCPYAAPDGWSLAKQLELRRLVRERDGLWELTKR